MKISIITLFPEMFEGPFDYSMVRRAKDQGLVTINLINLRDFGLGKHKLVDDTPYGGGRGMIIRVDVLDSAIKAVKDKNLNKKTEKVFLLSPAGETFNQKTAKSLSKLSHLIIICGHYEGVDARICDFIDGEISIGDFIVTGGELPAMLVTDAVVRLLKGVLKEGVTSNESFSLIENNDIQLEHAHYTKPEIYKNIHVPKILLSGNHKKIELWRKTESKKLTKKLRPDLSRK